MSVAAGGLVSRLAAQSLPGDLVGYVSLHHSPIGLLAPVAPALQLGTEAPGFQLALRAAEHAKGDRDNKTSAYAATGVLPVGRRAAVSLTVGGYKETCPDPECRNIFMAGAGATLDLTPDLFHAGAGSPHVNLGLSTEIGWSAREFEQTYATGALGLPITMTSGDSRGFHVAPWLTPGVGFGRVTATFVSPGARTIQTTNSGARPLLGGGLALYDFASSASLQVGAKYVFGAASRPVLGLTAVLGR
jgi:hypothetical protein